MFIGLRYCQIGVGCYCFIHSKGNARACYKDKANSVPTPFLFYCLFKGAGGHIILDTMKKSVLITIGCLFSIAARSQFVTYEAVPRPNISIPESNFRFNFPQPTIPNISVVNSDIVTMEALCVQTEGENFIIGTKVIVRTLSNGATTLGLIGIKQGQKWNSLDEIGLISISKSLAQAKTKEEKDFLLMLSDFSYMAALGEYSLLLFK